MFDKPQFFTPNNDSFKKNTNRRINNDSLCWESLFICTLFKQIAEAIILQETSCWRHVCALSQDYNIVSAAKLDRRCCYISESLSWGNLHVSVDGCFKNLNEDLAKFFKTDGCRPADWPRGCPAASGCRRWPRGRRPTGWCCPCSWWWARVSSISSRSRRQQPSGRRHGTSSGRAWPSSGCYWPWCGCCWRSWRSWCWCCCNSCRCWWLWYVWTLWNLEREWRTRSRRPRSWSAGRRSPPLCKHGPRRKGDRYQTLPFPVTPCSLPR